MRRLHVPGEEPGLRFTPLLTPQEFAAACRKLFILSAGGLKDMTADSSDEIKATYAGVHAWMVFQ